MTLTGTLEIALLKTFHLQINQASSSSTALTRGSVQLDVGEKVSP
jgi:hypothetical protein